LPLGQRAALLDPAGSRLPNPLRRALVTPKPPDGVARRKKPKACTDAPTAKAPTTDAPAAVPARITPQTSANGAANALPSALAPTAVPVAPIPAPSAPHAVPLAHDDSDDHHARALAPHPRR
jgi:hypothetical protein